MQNLPLSCFGLGLSGGKRVQLSWLTGLKFVPAPPLKDRVFHKFDNFRYFFVFS